MANRNYALDFLRGLTIALMIVVNNPGDWQQMFALLRHAEWHGFLGADIVFPLFLFVAGYAAALKVARSFSRGPSGPHCASQLTLEENEPPSFYLPLVRRAAILFAIGIFLNAWPFGVLPGTEFSLGNIRLLGVLQRIALCVLAGGILLYRVQSTRGVVVSLAALAAAYEFLMRVPFLQTAYGQFGRSFDLADNFARLVDLSAVPLNMLYKVHKVPFDPEGLLTTFTALMTFLLGALCYRMQSNRVSLAVTLLVLGAGLACLEPINKNLWTLPYVLLTGGSAVVLLSLGEKMRLDAGRISPVLTAPLAYMGKNPLLIYVLSGLAGKALAVAKTASGISYKAVLFNYLQVLPLSAKVASLFYSLILLVLLALLARSLRRIPLSV